MTHDELREAVARAIWERADDEVGWAATVALSKTGDAYMVGQVEFVRREADAALAAIREAGFAIVPEWQPIKTAPHETNILLGWIESSTGNWECQTGFSSGGKLHPNGYSSRWFHGRATHWMSLPAPPETEGDGE